MNNAISYNGNQALIHKATVTMQYYTRNAQLTFQLMDTKHGANINKLIKE